MKRALLSIVLLLTLSTHALAQVASVPSLLSFQGRLAKPDGTPVPNGTYSVKFSLFTALTGGTQKWTETDSVSVKNGVFAVQFGRNSALSDAIFAGNLFLEIKVGSDPVLTPRQQLVSVAYAMKADTVPDASIGSAQIKDGAVTSGKLAANIFNSLGWSLAGNAGTTASQFLGTTDNKPLLFKANNRRVLRFEDKANATNTFHAINVLGGSGINTIAANVLGATIAGGGQDNNSGADSPNDIRGNFGFIGGGSGNFIDAYTYATIAGGSSNVLQGNYSVIGGGTGNNAQGDYALIGGGSDNYLSATYATIGGGLNDQAGGTRAFVGGGDGNQANGTHAAVGGGGGNTALDYGVVAGGKSNNASGPYAFIGGGQLNVASALYATVGSGQKNSVSGEWATIGGGSTNIASAQMSAIGGGDQNYAGNTWATVAGGLQNWATGLNTFVGGGYLNQATNTYAMAPGGYYNYSGGVASFAAGYRGVSSYNGSFVWSDYSAEQDFSATAANQFCIRATGGIVVEAFGSPAIFTGVGTTDAGRYVLLLNSPRAPSASGLKAGGILCADSFGYANPGKNNLSVKGTVGIGYPDPNPYTLGVNGTGFFSGKVYALDYGYASDARFKRHIATWDHALDTIQNLRGVSFDWDRDAFKDRHFPEGRHIGFLAQEIERVLPELVTTGADGYKSVSYAGVIPVLVEAMKQQQQQIEALQAARSENAALRAEMAELKALVRQLAAQQNPLSR